MSPALIAFVVIGAITAVVGAVYAMQRGAKVAKLRAVPLVKLAEAQDGARVRVCGVARADKAIHAPLTGAAAVVATSEHWETSSHGGRVRRIDRQVFATPFELDDASAVARIATDHVDVLLTMKPAKPATSGPGRVFGAGVIAANMSSAHELLEGYVAPGARVTVVGTVRRDAAGTIELFGIAGAPVVVTDEVE